MPKWVWWAIGAIVVLMIWRGQGAALGQGIGRFVHGVFTALANIRL